MASIGGVPGPASDSGTNYKDMESNYRGFQNPHVVIKVNKKDMVDKKSELKISQVSVDLSSGFEASVASFRIYGVFDRDAGKYLTKKYEKLLHIGSSIEISMGYSIGVSPVFVGVITKLNFIYEDPELPYILLTAMDAKGIMMANNHSKQLTATTIDAAVKEILDGQAYKNLLTTGIITKISVEATPDSPGGGTGGAAGGAGGAAPAAAPTGAAGGSESEKPTIEMVGESDYEFIVRMAKRINYEFFISVGEVIFRPARVDTDSIMTLSPSNILRSFDFEYDITGQVGTVEVRATDTDKGELITSSQKVSNKWSFGKKAEKLVKGHKMVYLDPSVHTKEEADMRKNFLVDNISYKFATLNCETLGVPELVPGKFIKVAGLGEGPDNKFYLQEVRHVMSKKGEYKCIVVGKAKSIEEQQAVPGMGSVPSL